MACSVARPFAAYARAKFPACVFARGSLVVISPVVALDPAVDASGSVVVPLAAYWCMRRVFRISWIFSSSRSWSSASMSAHEADEADCTELLVMLAGVDFSLFANYVLLL